MGAIEQRRQTIRRVTEEVFKAQREFLDRGPEALRPLPMADVAAKVGVGKVDPFLFGAIAPTLVAWFVVASIKGQPIAAGWQPFRMLTGLIINGAWGVGTGLFLTAAAGASR